MLKLLVYPWSQVFIEFYRPLSSDENLLIWMKMYSSYATAEILKNASAQLVLRKFNKIYSVFCYLKKVLSDNGSPF